MLISKDTKVSTVIRYNPEAVEVIASVNKHFSKLRNPVLRKLLAPRVSLSEAAKIGKCDVQLLLQRLETIGFQIENNDQLQVEEMVLIETNTGITENAAVTLDVTPILEQGEDPFNQIMEAVNRLAANEQLCVISPFEPIPLIRILRKKGIAAKTVQQMNNYHTYLTKQSSPEIPGNDRQEVSLLSANVFREKALTLGRQLVLIDVRNLEMPLPMINVLNALQELSNDQALLVQHSKIPHYLLEELKERNFEALLAETTDKEIHLLIFTP